MGKKNLDWGNLPFGYMKTSKSFVANYKNGEWDEGKLTSKPTIDLLFKTPLFILLLQESRFLYNNFRLLFLLDT